MPLFLQFTRTGQPAIKGASKAKFHEGWIEIASMQWGPHRFAPRVNPDDRHPPPSVSDLVITKNVDAASSILFRETLSPPGDGLTAKIDFVKDGANPNDLILSITAENVIISAYSASGGRGAGATPLEQVTITFTRVMSSRHPLNAP
jgi:type VI protein secretion system component Hcp